jgi:hypothetical protein
MQHATQQEGDEKSTSRPLLEQFLQAFLQERSIKWMLLVGAAIIVVCSLKLVAQQWEDWHLSIKFFSILGYIATIFGFAEASNRLLGLKATSATLRGITLFLLPMSFLSLGWLSNHQSITLWEWLPTVVVGVGVVAYVSDSILREFLSGRQLTYQICFVLLGVIGSIPESFSIPTIGMAIAIWLTGTIGIIKINRHIFWLGEQHRAPMTAYQFFPVGLMGIEMLLLFSSKLRWVESQHWFGFAWVLCAIPVAVTAQSLLQVHRVRTGGLLKTWPVSAGVMLVICLLMATGGVFLSSNLLLQLGPDLKLLVPSSLLAAAIYFWAAYESKQPILTSLGLGLVVIGYTISPVWFADLARGVASTAASGLNESRLPIAFYGLTCLPLILGWSTLAYALKSKSLRVAQGDWRVFYMPLIWGANLLGLALLLFSASNTKAMFLIPACYVVYYIFQATMWNDRRYMVGTLFAMSAAIYSAVPFGNAMFGWQMDSSMSFVLLGVWCNLLFILPMEGFLQRFRLPDATAKLWPVWKGRLAPLGQLFALILLTILSLTLATHALRVGGAGMSKLDWIWLALVLIGHALNTTMTRRYVSGAAHCIAWTFAIALLFSRIAHDASDWMWLISAVSTIGSGVGYLLTRNSQIGFGWSEMIHLHETRPNRNRPAFVSAGTLWDALCVPARDWFSILSMACCGMHFVMLLDIHWNLDRSFQLSLILTMAWLLGSIAVLRLPLSVIIFTLMAPLAVSGFALHMNWISTKEDAVPLLWGLVVGALVLPISLWNRHVEDAEPWVKWLEHTASAWCVLLLFLCCIPVVPLLAWAGLIALVVLYGVRQPSLGSSSFGAGAVACHYYAFMLMCHGMRVNPFEILFVSGWVQSRSYVSIVLSFFVFSLLAIQTLLPHLDRRFARGWEGGLMLLIFKMTWIACVSTRADIQWCLVGTALLFLLSGVEMAKAYWAKNESRVWICLGLLLGAILLGTAKIPFAEFAEYIPIGWTCLAISLAWCAQRSLTKDDWKFIAHPFQIVAMGIASCLSVWFVMTHLFGIHEHGKSVTTFCLFLASFYSAFEAYVTKSTWSFWALLVLLNAGLTSWTRAIGWSDLQFYLVPLGFSIVAMVELLRANLTKSTAYNLRLTGSLVALVSPLAQIVQGSWWHLISLMVLSVLVVLLAIGLRIKVLMATGTAFLAVDLVSILVRTAMDKPGGLWIAGLSIGVVVIALGAVCEIYRDRIRTRIRVLSDELATWN